MWKRPSPSFRVIFTPARGVLGSLGVEVVKLFEHQHFQVREFVVEHVCFKLSLLNGYLEPVWHRRALICTLQRELIRNERL